MSRALLIAILASLTVLSSAGTGEPVGIFNDDVTLDTSQVRLPTPAEDDPGWDCYTMGNKICGPGAGVTDRVAATT